MNDEQIALGEVDPALGIATIGISTADSLWHRGVILTDLGRFQEAAEALRRADERARRFGGNEMASWIDFWSVRNLSRAGDASGAQSMGRRAIESAEKIGSVLGRVGAYPACSVASGSTLPDAGLKPAATSGVLPSAVPHSPQNFSSGSQVALHCGHRRSSAAPQFTQNLRPDDCRVRTPSTARSLLLNSGETLRPVARHDPLLPFRRRRAAPRARVLRWRAHRRGPERGAHVPRSQTASARVRQSQR